MTKAIYVVWGSEDGFLDAFSNKKAAYNCAENYIKGSCDFKEGDVLDTTYSQLCKEFKLCSRLAPESVLLHEIVVWCQPVGVHSELHLLSFRQDGQGDAMSSG